MCINLAGRTRPRDVCGLIRSMREKKRKRSSKTDLPLSVSMQANVNEQIATFSSSLKLDCKNLYTQEYLTINLIFNSLCSSFLHAFKICGLPPQYCIVIFKNHKNIITKNCEICAAKMINFYNLYIKILSVN